MARSKSAPAPAAVSLVPARSSFDFLEGGFVRSERSRVMGLLVIGAGIVVVGVVAVVGLLALFDKQSKTSELADTRARITAATNELSQKDQAEDHSADQLAGHVNERKAALRKALGNEIDVVKLLTDLQATTPAGVTITAVKVTEAAPAGQRPATSSSASSSPADGLDDEPASSGSTGAASAGGTSAQVQVTGTVTDFALIGTWSQAVSGMNGVSSVNPTWSGGGTAISTTLTITLTDAALSERAAQLKTKEQH